MSGIVGMITPAHVDGNLPETLQRMVSPLARHPKMQVSAFTGEVVGMAAIHRENDGSRLAAKDGVRLVVSGHVLQQADLRRQLPKDTPPTTGLADLLLNLYMKCGLSSICGLNGLYVLAIWEEAERKLTIVKDRQGGSSNLYYWLTPRHFMFASEIKGIAWHPRFDQSIDPLAVCDLFSNQIPSGERTLFKEIRAMMGGTILTYQDSRLELKPYWQPAFYTGDPIRDEDSYIDEMADHIRAAVRRRIQPATCMFVTGGLDARTLLGFHRLEAPDLQIAATTIGKRSGLDVIIGKKIAAAAGIPHYWLPLNSDYLNHFAALSAWRAEGKMSSFASWIYAGEPFLEEQGFRCAITGHYGNFVSGRNIPKGLREEMPVEKGADILRYRYRRSIEEFKRLMNPALLPHLEASMEYAPTIFKNTDTYSILNRFDAFALQGSMARSAGGADALGDVVTVLDPFTDKDLIDYAISMPPQVRACPWFYERLIARHLPEMAAVPHGRTGYPVTTDLMINRYPALKTLDYYRRRVLKRMMPDRYSEEAQGCIPFNEALHHGSRPLMLETLAKREYLEPFFDMKAVKGMIDEQQSRRSSRLYRPLTVLMTLVMFREQFEKLQNSP